MNIWVEDENENFHFISLLQCNFLFVGPDGEAAEILQTDCPTQDHEEIISDGNVHKEVVIEEDVIEDGQDSDKQFKVF